MNCMRCKSAAYCSADCQRQDWKDHKPTCQRKEFAGAPCDCCGSTEDVDTGDMCLKCGFLYCKVCDRQLDLSDGHIVVSAPCPRCQQLRAVRRPSDRYRLEKLIKESPRDPRLAHWLIHLGELFANYDDSRRGDGKAKDHFLHAGQLGLGEGFSRVAELYIKRRNWDEARRYYHLAAQKFRRNRESGV
jgi:MYND finger